MQQSLSVVEGEGMQKDEGGVTGGDAAGGVPGELLATG